MDILSRSMLEVRKSYDAFFQEYLAVKVVLEDTVSTLNVTALGPNCVSHTCGGLLLPNR